MKAIRLLLLSLMVPVLAFAHGGEDHSHDEVPSAQTAIAGEPRIETATETFEIVGRLQHGELSLLIDRYETNEPVLGGQVEVEVNGHKANARFHADHGNYAVDDQAFLKALGQPGTHALVFTVAAGSDTDLLEATLTVGDEGRAATARAAPRFSLSTAAAGGVGLALSVLLSAIAIALARRKSSTGN